MVIHKINVESVAIFKTKNDPPVCPNSHREKSLQPSLERVQTKGWHIHALNLWRSIQRRENEPEPLQHVRRQFAAIVMLEQSLQAFVAKVFNHKLYCKT
jgi:hypothetical protein